MSAAAAAGHGLSPGSAGGGPAQAAGLSPSHPNVAARGSLSYSSLPFAGPSTRPGTPADPGQYAFSTTLRRQSIGEDDGELPHFAAAADYGRGTGTGAGTGSSGSNGNGRDYDKARNGASRQPLATFLKNAVAALPGSPLRAVSNGSSYLPVSSFGGKDYDARDHQLPGTSSSLPPSTVGSGNSHASPHHPFAHTSGLTTPSARFARCSISETAAMLQTNLDTGLSSGVVSAIREISGPNEFTVESQEKALSKFLKQFYESPLILLLLGSAGVSAAVGNYDDSVSITLAIVIVVTVGFVQEQRSEKSLEALNKLVPHYCHVIRDGTRQSSLANVLVPGDIVYFGVGDRVPADIRLIRTADLEVDESNLTGETKPARKHTDALDGFGMGHDPGISERRNTAFMGTLVRNGHGSGIVVATGQQSEFGVIFSMMQEVEDKKTPLQLSMDELAKKLSAISFVVIGFICLIGVYQQRSWLEMFTIGVSLAVAAIPEGLPIVVTVTLALGVLRMSKRKAIVKKLPSVETLGSVSVICSDKTGTLTTNEMTTVKMYTVDDGIIEIHNHHNHQRHHQSGLNKAALPTPLTQAIVKTALVGNLCNRSFRNKEGVVVGPSTEVALFNVLQVLGLSDRRAHFTKVSEEPFNSEKKWQSVTGTIVDEPIPTGHSLSRSVTPSMGGPAFAPSSRETTYTSGALETVLARCGLLLRSDGSTAPLDASYTSIITSKAAELSAAGLRVVALACGPDPASLLFCGLQGIMDPPRPGVADAIAALNAASVQVVMITGDAEETAIAIARELGIRVNRAGQGGVLSGRDIDALSQRQLQDRIGGVSVFARTTPRHKMAIIEAFQSRGAVVAMTGDGVNDAPALKMADIGISMGKGGTDVAKEAADVILVDDNFATILTAVEEGKSIFYNIQNFLGFQLSTAVAALTLITLSTALRLPTPLNPMQILFINILMDGPPSQSLGVDPVNKEVMRRPPRAKNAPVLTTRLLYRILFSASMIVLGTLFIYGEELSDGETAQRDQTMTFTSFVFLDLVSAVQNRGLSCGLRQNRMLVLTVSISFVAQLLLVYFPPLQSVFQTEALSLRDLTVLLALGGISFSLHEARRRYERTLNDKIRYAESVV